MEEYFELYTYFKTLVRHERIENPSDLIFVCVFSPLVKNCLSLKGSDVYFTRKSLKHIAEKGNDELVGYIASICIEPHEIRKGFTVNRYLVVRNILEKGNRPYVVCIEISETKTTIVTVFPSDAKYLSNFDLLWRTGVS